ncbi:ATP synthase subunit I [Sphingomonas sp. TDK1]|jgi:F1F0 ATPase subunit 2|uniref:ATP synthase subunit I n=1 Tax=Sphingomonas sp. TDK1 TaxID=453247 RepID=UPI0007DA04AE|nr:ATP synthase subunit I [Sphingomonas sp. TDK1]OAN65074.1 hypothetical protein A7X12_16345 [Sphingomonas sp. TDK1]
MIAIPLFLTLGVVAGAVHFVALARDTDLLVRGESPTLAMALRLARIALIVVVLVLATRQGWPTLLAAALGFAVARTLVIRRIGGVVG